MQFVNIFQLRKNLLICHIHIYTNIFCVSAEVSTLMFISEGLDPYMFRRKMWKTRPMRDELDEKVFVPTRVGISFL